MINATLVGRLTADPETKTAKDGSEFLAFTLACQKTKDSAEFIKCTAYGNTANVVHDFCKKGSMIAAVGRLSLNVYTDKEGYEQKNLQCQVQQVALCGGKADNDEGEGKAKPKRRKASEKTQEPTEEFQP